MFFLQVYFIFPGTLQPILMILSQKPVWRVIYQYQEKRCKAFADWKHYQWNVFSRQEDFGGDFQMFYDEVLFGKKHISLQFESVTKMRYMML